MTRYCEVTKKLPLVGNNVSHANNKSKRRFLPNLQTVSFFSDILNRKIRLRLSAKGIKTIESKGGFDNFILNEKNSNLGVNLKKYKEILVKRVSIQQ